MREKSAVLIEERKKELAKQSKQRESLQKQNQDLERKESEHQQEIEITEFIQNTTFATKVILNTILVPLNKRYCLNSLTRH